LPGARTGFAAGFSAGFGAPEEAPADTVMRRPPNLVLNRSIPPIESIPEQERTGTRFGIDAQGLIDVLRIPPAIDDLQRFHYDEMRHKAEALAALGQMLGDIAPAATRILEALPEGIEGVSIDRLWSHGNTLRRRHDAHVRTIDCNLGPDPARLHPLVAANLGDFIDSFNVYVIGDPRGLELDRIRLGPQDREAARKVAALAAPIARAAGEPESPATPAAQETLAEQVSSAIDAPSSPGVHPPPRRALGHPALRGGFSIAALTAVGATQRPFCFAPRRAPCCLSQVCGHTYVRHESNAHSGRYPQRYPAVN
jgi:hypothetical protein